jgi:hypothetical protein
MMAMGLPRREDNQHVGRVDERVRTVDHLTARGLAEEDHIRLEDAAADLTRRDAEVMPVFDHRVAVGA